MSKAKRCPNCRLVSPGSAQICDCGYNFESGGIDDPPAGRSLPNAKASGGGRGLVLAGGALIVLGIGITAVTHSAAESAGGGTYIVAYGPIIAGASMLIRGLARGL